MNSIYKIERVSGDGKNYIYKAEINASHDIFNGHFPDNPVVPGVCTIGMLKECFADILNREVKLDYIKECKFLSAIIPTQHKSVCSSIVITQNESVTSVIAEVSCGDIKMVKFKAELL